MWKETDWVFFAKNFLRWRNSGIGLWWETASVYRNMCIVVFVLSHHLGRLCCVYVRACVCRSAGHFWLLPLLERELRISLEPFSPAKKWNRRICRLESLFLLLCCCLAQAPVLAVWLLLIPFAGPCCWCSVCMPLRAFGSSTRRWCPC